VHGGVNVIQAAFGLLRQRGGFGDVGFNHFFAEGFLLAAFSLAGFFAPAAFLAAGFFVPAAFLATGFFATAVFFAAGFFVSSNSKSPTA